MNKTYYIVLLLVLINQIMVGINISGRVIADNGKPIIDASVYDKKTLVKTNKDGYFYLKTDSDSILVWKLSYSKRSFSVKSVPEVIVLNSMPIEMSTIRVSYLEQVQNKNAIDAISINTDADKPVESITDVIATQTGISSNSIRLSGESIFVGLTGSLNKHTLVLIDGVPVNPNGEEADLSLINPATIDRIEIIRNNASAYGGASAIGGMLSIHTKKAKPETSTGISTNTSFGSFKMIGSTSSFQYNDGKISHLFDWKTIIADNDFHYKQRSWWPNSSLTSTKRDNNRKEQISLSYRLGYSLLSGDIVYRAAYERFVRQLPGPVDFLEVYKNSILNGETFLQNIQLFNGNNKMYYSLNLWANNNKTHYDNTHAPLPAHQSDYHQELQSFGAKSNTGWNFQPDAKLELRAEHDEYIYNYRNIINPNNSIIDEKRSISAVSLHTEKIWDFSQTRLTVKLSDRYDAVHNQDCYNTWRAESAFTGYYWITTTVGGTYGTSFALPSFYDLYWKGDAQTIGNPELKAEVSQGGQIWSEFNIDQTSLKVAYNRNNVDDMILWRQVYLFGTSWKPFNISSAVIDNVELSFHSKLKNILNISCVYNKTSAIDKSLQEDGTHSATYNKRLMYIPDQAFSAAIDTKIKKCGLWAKIHYIGRQWTTADNQIDPLKSYYTVDTGCSWQQSIKMLDLNAYFNLNNVLDKQYEIYAYVPQPGFNWSAGITLSVSRDMISFSNDDKEIGR